MFSFELFHHLPILLLDFVLFQISHKTESVYSYRFGGSIYILSQNFHSLTCSSHQVRQMSFPKRAVFPSWSMPCPTNSLSLYSPLNFLLFRQNGITRLDSHVHIFHGLRIVLRPDIRYICAVFILIWITETIFKGL